MFRYNYSIGGHVPLSPAGNIQALGGVFVHVIVIFDTLPTYECYWRLLQLILSSTDVYNNIE